MRRHGSLLFCWLLSLCLLPGRAADTRLPAFARQQALDKESPFRTLFWRNLGPRFCGGRVVDVEGYGNKPEKIVLATASGGVWLTENGGESWSACFENEATTSIGDIALLPNDEKVIWVGSGEANALSSGYAGIGVYRSDDGGKSWRHMGLSETQHIGRIVIDPSHPDTVYVAALGQLYAENEERGVFKTDDGGRTWKKVLFISAGSGVVDLVMPARNPQILYAAAWQRHREPWNFVEGGPESGIFKTTDGGTTWQRCTAGLPQNRDVGRIGLAISQTNPEVIYALLDNQAAKSAGTGKHSGIAIDRLGEMSEQEFLALADEKLSLFLAENRAPSFYSAGILKNLVRSGQLTPQVIARMLFAANDRRLNPNIIGAEVYRSDDAGKNWRKVNRAYIEEMYYTYGFYFGQIRVSPENENIVYILGVSLYQSIDGGQTFRQLSQETSPLAGGLVHCDQHALWINPQQPDILYLGNDGGLNISLDRGKSWRKTTSLSIAQCYTVNFDNQQPCHVYIGTQDNGVLAASSQSASDEKHDWQILLGGDGAKVALRPDNPELIFAAAQFGALFRIDVKNKKSALIQPKSPEEFEPYRFSWISPLLASVHQPAKLLLGAQRVLASLDGGSNWLEISPDLTEKKQIDGNVPYATITVLAESPLLADTLYAGTDDGNIWRTANGGKDWRKISQVLPRLWVTTIVPSRYRRERVYAAVNGRLQGDYHAYLFYSENGGLDWEQLGGDLPQAPVNVLAEDTARENILYLGTDLGVYISIDGGASWHSLRGNLPTVPVTDLQLQPRDQVLLLATHGRGVYMLPRRAIMALLPPTRQQE